MSRIPPIKGTDLKPNPWDEALMLADTVTAVKKLRLVGFKIQDLKKHGTHDQSTHGNWARGINTQSDGDPDLKSILEAESKFFSISRSGYQLQGTVLKYGRSYPAPAPGENSKRILEWDVDPGELHRCFKNSGSVAAFGMQGAFGTGELTYVEGFAVAPGLEGSAIHHAWLVTPGGDVIDPTWATHNDMEPGIEYIGIPIKQDWLNRRLVETGYWGVFSGKPIEDLEDGIQD